PGLELVFRQAPAHGLARDVVVLGEPDQFIGQEFQRPAGAAFGRARTGRCDQQGLLFAGELALCPKAWLFAKRRLQVAKHEAALGPIDGRAAHPDAPRDLLAADAGVRSQQKLRPLELARRVLAAPEDGLEFEAIAYIQPCRLLAGGRDEQLNRMAGVSPSAKTFTPRQGQYLAYIHLYTRLHRRPPAEADIQQYFCVTPPSVHQMVLTLE